MAALQGGAGLAVYLVAALDDGAVEGAEARALDDAADAYEGEDERHEGEVGQLYGPAVGVRAALVIVTPALPVLPGGIAARIRGPTAAVKVPFRGGGRRGRAVMASPAVAPGVVCLALLHIRENIVGSDQHAVALQTDVQRQMCNRRGLASVGVVQLHEGIKALLRIQFALATFQNLIRRRGPVRLDGLRPLQQLRVLGVVRREVGVGVGVGIAPLLSMTA